MESAADSCSLTGESKALRKTNVLGIEKPDDGLFELDNIIFMGTSVISGSGVALVLRTGDGKLTLPTMDWQILIIQMHLLQPL